MSRTAKMIIEAQENTGTKLPCLLVGTKVKSLQQHMYVRMYEVIYTYKNNLKIINIKGVQ